MPLERADRGVFGEKIFRRLADSSGKLSQFARLFHSGQARSYLFLGVLITLLSSFVFLLGGPMTADRILLLVYLALPFAAAFMPGGEGNGLFSKGSVATLLRIVLLLLLGRTMLVLNGVVEARATLVEGYPLDIVLSLNTYRYGFLVMAEFCFLLAHWTCPVGARGTRMIRTLVGFAQGSAR